VAKNVRHSIKIHERLSTMRITRSKGKSMSEHAYEELKRMILHLHIKPGEHIQEERITELLGCSRTPVREALRKLNIEGLVTIYPSSHSEVTYFDDNSIRRIGELRLAQDVLSCQLAILYGSNYDFAKLTDLTKKCEASAKDGNIYERIVFDNRFHLEIAKIGGNELLYRNQEKLYMKVHLIQISRYTNIEDSLEQISIHYDIIKALYERNYNKIRKLTCLHLKNFYSIQQNIIDMYML